MSTTAKPPTITVAKYRRLIDGLAYAFASLQSAATPAERVREVDWVRRSARELMDATCPRAKEDDRAMAERLVDRTASYLIRNGLDAGSTRR